MDCSLIPEISHAEFCDSLFEKATNKRIPISGGIEVTMECNLNCKHCYAQGISQGKEMTSQEFFNTIDEIVSLGCFWLLFTGGEPFNRSDFLDIYTYAKKKGLVVSIFTNATLITSKIADYLSKWCPFIVEVTLYGISKETYERITGITGSFEKCMRGIHLLLEKKIPVALKTVVMKLNKHEILEMKKFAKDLGVDFRYSTNIQPRIDGTRKPVKLRLSPEEILKFDRADQERFKRWKELILEHWGTASNPEYLYNCRAGLNSFHIDPFGKLSICLMSRNSTYDLRNGSFWEGWYNFIPKVRSVKAPLNYKCRDCEMIALCGQCPAWIELENNGIIEPVKYLCQIAHLRSKVITN